IKQIGGLLKIDLLVSFGEITQYMMGPAIGAGVAYSLNVSPLAIFASIATGAIGAGTVSLNGGDLAVQIGEPVGALVAVLVGAEFSKLIQGKTKVDIVLVPISTVLVGGLTGHY